MKINYENIVSYIILLSIFFLFYGCNLSVKTYPKRSYKILYCYKVKGKRYCVKDVPVGYTQVGIASWYGPNFHGKKTATGEIYNMYDLTAAHKTLPLNTYVKVINLENGKSVVVRINDRGPFVKNRILDLSYAAAKKLGITKKGTALVKIIVLGKEKKFNYNSNNKNFRNLKKLKFYSYKTLEKILKKYKNKKVILAVASYKSYYYALKKYKYLKRKGFKVFLREYNDKILVLIGPYKINYVLKRLYKWKKYGLKRYSIIFIF